MSVTIGTTRSARFAACGPPNEPAVISARPRLVCRLVCWIALFAAALSKAAFAIDVRCIEESKYKHLYQLFGGDARKFAAYLNIGVDRLPDPEICRAVLVFGDIGEARDREKLLDVVARSKGWLAAVHLNSGGGDVWTGQQLGYIVRAFRLKTVTARTASNRLLYNPDFAVGPLPPGTPGRVPDRISENAKPRPPRCLLHEHVPTAVFFEERSASGVTRPEAFKPTNDDGIDRPNGDYGDRDIADADPKACQRLCLDEGRCRAWAYRKPDNGRPHCWLKDRVLARIKDQRFVSGIARADAPDATYEDSTDIPAESYRDLDPRADPRICQKACIDDVRCQAWVYSKPEAHCWLKKRVLPSRKDDTFISGSLARFQYLDPTYEENIDRHGSDYREFDLARADPKLCQKACVEDARCRAWNYRKPEGRTDNKPHCWLKDRIPSENGADDLNISGIVMHNFEPTFERGINRIGQEYRQVDLAAPEPRACQKVCADDGKCRAWVYQEPNSAFLASLATGWDAYQARQLSNPSKPSPGSDWCASSCVHMHVAGLDRTGVVQVHRPNQGFSRMSATSEDLTTNDAGVPRFYRYMDAGRRITQLMRETSATTVRETVASRFPRYILDYLIHNCGSDPEQLDELGKRLELAVKELNPAVPDVSLKLDHLQTAIGRLHDKLVRAEQCVAQAMEKDRLEAYEKLCGRSCDQNKLGADFDAELKKILEFESLTRAHGARLRG